VTSFFRDPDAFAVLAAEIIPRLFERRHLTDALRVWVPGCATGEEAYTIAILLLEEAARRELRPDIQIFASDLDSGALAMGREGRYPAAISADVSEDRLGDFLATKTNTIAYVARCAISSYLPTTVSSRTRRFRGSISFLPESSDLSGPRPAAAGLQHFPLCSAAGRFPVCWHVRSCRHPARPVRRGQS